GPWFLGDPDRLLFTARRMTERGVSLFERPIEGPGETKLLFADETMALASIRDDGQELLLLEGTHASELFVVSLPAAGPPRRLFPEPGRDVTITGVMYAPGGERVLVATDDGGDGCHVLAIDIATGTITGRYTEPVAPLATARSLRLRER